MRNQRATSLIRLFVLTLAACGPASSFPPPALTPGDTWSVKLTQTGGFVGVHWVVVVSSDGWMRAEDQRSLRVISKPVSEAAILELRRLMAQTVVSETDRFPSACADCYMYDLEITSSAGTTRIRADDTDLGESGAQGLIEFLGRLRDQALQSAN